LKLISIHIPKTAGTSFYHILQQVYGPELSVSFKRRDIVPLLRKGELTKRDLSPSIQVIHGHFYYQEIARLHRATDAKVICWLREPVDRLLSNYHFFKAGLLDPERNPVQFAKNKHRIGETILEFARLPENQNRMHSFLAGLPLDDLFFCGFLGNFAADVNRLGNLLDWPPVRIEKLNQNSTIKRPDIDSGLRVQLEKLNQKDIKLYQYLKAQSAQYE
jgi:hypothetical protein